MGSGGLERKVPCPQQCGPGAGPRYSTTKVGGGGGRRSHWGCAGTWLHCCILSTRGQERPTHEAPAALAAELLGRSRALAGGAEWSGKCREDGRREARPESSYSPQERLSRRTLTSNWIVQSMAETVAWGGFEKVTLGSPSADPVWTPGLGLFGCPLCF